MSDRAEQDIEVRGALAVEDGVGVVSIELAVPASRGAVWTAVTEPEGLTGWLGVIEGDLRAGGSFHGRWFPSGWDGTGRILDCEPGSRYLVESAEAERPLTTDELRLEPADGGGTRVVLTKRGVPVAVIAMLGVGLQIHLENLAAHLAGRGPVDPDPRWAALLPGYERLAAAL